MPVTLVLSIGIFVFAVSIALILCSANRRSELSKRIDELLIQGFVDVGHGELLPRSFRLINIADIGGTLLEICIDAEGYYSVWYDNHGEYVRSLYIPR